MLCANVPLGVVEALGWSKHSRRMTDPLATLQDVGKQSCEVPSATFMQNQLHVVAAHPADRAAAELSPADHCCFDLLSCFDLTKSWKV